MNKPTVNIYVCTHKKFDVSIIPNDNYYVLDSNDINNELKPLEFGYAEGYHIYEIWKNIKPSSDYVGICHYRRYFDTAHFDLSYDIILPNYVTFGGQTLFEQYCNTGSKKDILLIGKIINTYYNDYLNDYFIIMNRTYFYPCNMFIMSTNNFNKYCEWCFDILKKFTETLNLKTYDDLIRYTIANKSNIGNMNNPNIDTYFTTVQYNSRIIGGIMERLLNIYVNHNFKNIKTYDIKMI